MRRLLLASYHFPPSRAVGAQRAERLARLLPEFGYQVDVVCALTEPPEIENGQAATGRIRPRITRVRQPLRFGRDSSRTSPPAAPLARVSWKARAYVERLLLTKDWSWRWAAAACSSFGTSFGERGYDVMVVEAPPNPSVVPFLRLGQREGIPVILDFRDLWVTLEEPISFWEWVVPHLRRRDWERRLRVEAIRAAHHVVVNTPPAVDFFTDRFPALLSGGISCIPNAFGYVDPVQESIPGPEPGASCTIAYTGSLAYGRDEQLKRFICGMRKLRQREGLVVNLKVIGGGGKSIIRCAEDAGLSGQVHVHAWSSRDDTIRIQREADGLLLLQPSTEVGTRLAVPAKLFEYMARRKNIIALVGPGPVTDIIRTHDLGVVASGEAPGQVAGALKSLLARLGQKPFLPPPPEEFSERNTVSRLAQVLDGVLSSAP